MPDAVGDSSGAAEPVASTATVFSTASVASSGVGGRDGETLSAESAEDSGLDPPPPRGLDREASTRGDGMS